MFSPFSALYSDLQEYTLCIRPNARNELTHITFALKSSYRLGLLVSEMHC